MPADRFQHKKADDVVLLDACCVINLCASGHFGSIVENLPQVFAVAREVVSESLYVRSSLGLSETNRIELNPFIGDNLLTVVYPETEAETASFVDFAGTFKLDDGEAMTCAVALHRGYSVATDDARTLKIFSGLSTVPMLTTPQLLKQWTDLRKLTPEEVRLLVQDVEYRARFRPNKGHVLFKWWMSFA